MKLQLKTLNSNPFKKEINKGKLNQETIDKIKANIKELGLMGALPIIKKENKFHLIMGHHRVEALKQTFGKDYEIEVTLHDYDDEKVLRGMIIENLTQRADELVEVTENLGAIRKFLKETAVQQLDSRDCKGRQLHKGNIEEAGSVRNIHDWLNKNGEVMSISKVAEYLKVHDNLDKKLLKTAVNSLSGKKEDKIGIEEAKLLSKINKADQHIIKKALDETGLDYKHKSLLVTDYKKADMKTQDAIKKGEMNIKLVPLMNSNSPEEVKKAVMNEEITFEQAERISKLKTPEARKTAIAEHKGIKMVDKGIEKNIEMRMTAREKKKLNKNLLQANNWIRSFRNSITDSRTQLKKTISVLLVATKFISLMDGKQRERLDEEIDRFIEILDKGNQLAEQIQEKNNE